VQVALELTSIKEELGSNLSRATDYYHGDVVLNTSPSIQFPAASPFINTVNPLLGNGRETPVAGLSNQLLGE
jgi:hypothetical protein